MVTGATGFERSWYQDISVLAHPVDRVRVGLGDVPLAQRGGPGGAQGSVRCLCVSASQNHLFQHGKPSKTRAF